PRNNIQPIPRATFDLPSRFCRVLCRYLVRGLRTPAPVVDYLVNRKCRMRTLSASPTSVMLCLKAHVIPSAATLLDWMNGFRSRGLAANVVLSLSRNPQHLPHGFVP